MMGLAKMAPDGWAYYAREIAAGVEDYFVGHGEETGRWIGRGTDGMGLAGEVDVEGLSLLFGQGRDPNSGEPLGRPFGGEKGSAVAGYALSFAPPKSVSILWALAGGEVADQVREAHDAAVQAAMEFLQDHAAFTRRGHGGTFQEQAGGYLGAVFVHRTSRAGDPQLHSHVLVANKVRAASDGRWLSIDGRELYEVQKAAGMLYKAAARGELTARLGVTWGDVDDNGGGEIVGVPDELIRQFSKRRAEVKTAAAELVHERESELGRSLTGDERAATFQLAAYQSRSAKEGAETTSDLRQRWQAEAAGAGYPVEGWISSVLDQPHKATGAQIALARRGIKPSVELALVEALDRLERTHSTWGRAQAIEALSTVLPAHRLGSADEVRHLLEAAADMLLTSNDVVCLTSPDRPDGRHGGLRYSTRWTLQTEQAVLDTVEAGRTAGVAIAPTYRALADAGLGDDQRNAVRALCGGGERVAVLVGPAGAGKTRTLAAARQAWQNAGIPVRGVAPSAVAAGVLTVEAGISSDTLAKFLLDVSARRCQLRAGEVIVCDEASMVSTRDLARLVLIAEAADAKVVLVGDHYQLGSVEAGGLFRLLATDAKTAELTNIRRFTDPWERQATQRLRAGDASVIGEYSDHRRVRSGDRQAALDAAHQAWLDARRQGWSVVVMAADHDTVDQLASRARTHRVAAGEVQADGFDVGGQTIGVGDEIVTLRNDRRLVTTTGAWVRNGDRWTIAGHTPSGALKLESLHGRGKVTLPADYVQNEHIALAYAVTVHKGQGVTCDQGVLVVDHATSAEHLYVGMTRGRHHNLACVSTETSGDEHTRRATPTSAHVLVAALRRASGEKSATETLRDELDRLQPQASKARQQAIVEGLRRAQANSYTQVLRQRDTPRATRYTTPSPPPSLSPAGGARRDLEL